MLFLSNNECGGFFPRVSQKQSSRQSTEATKAYSMTKKEKYFFGMQTGVTGSRKQFSGSRRKGMVPWKLRKHENVSYNLIFIYSHSR